MKQNIKKTAPHILLCEGAFEIVSFIVCGKFQL